MKYSALPRCFVRGVYALLGLVTLVVASAAPAHGTGRSTHGLLFVVHEHLSAWRFREAEALLVLVNAKDPGHSEVRRARARLAYLRGSYAQAAQLLQGLPEVLGTTDVSGLARQILACHAETRGWVSTTSTSGHFVFLHPPGLDEILVPYAAQALDRAREALMNDLGLAPDGPVRVEILPGASSLSRLSPLTEDEVRRTGTIALSRDRKLMLVTPRALLTGYGWIDTLVHEYVHYVLEVAARNRVPLWLHEGLARHAQERWRGPFPSGLTPQQEHLLAEALAANRLVPLERMVPSFAKLKDHHEAALAYAQVASMVITLKSRHGLDGFKSIIGHLARGRTMDEALRQVAGVDVAGFFLRWRRGLRRQGLKRLPHYEHQSPRFADSGQDPVEPSALPQGPVARHRRLGALLLRRGHSQAAAKAYDRAFGESGQANARIGNTLARLLLRLGRPDEAARVASGALRFHPEYAALHVTTARAAQARQRPAEAEAALYSALSVDPFDPEIHCSLARLLEARSAPRTMVALERNLCAKLKAAPAP